MAASDGSAPSQLPRVMDPPAPEEGTLPPTTPTPAAAAAAATAVPDAPDAPANSTGPAAAAAESTDAPQLDAPQRLSGVEAEPQGKDEPADSAAKQEELRLERRVALVARVKQIVGQLPEDTAGLWSEEHDSTVAEFLGDPRPRRLFAYFDGAVAARVLVFQAHALPPRSVKEMVYFIKCDTGAGNSESSTSSEASIGAVVGKGTERNVATEVTAENFEAYVQHGVLEGDLLECLLRTMQGVFSPMFRDNLNWPDSVKKDFRAHLHKFMAMLTDTAFQVKGHTVLYIPKEQFSYLEDPSRMKELTGRLESLVIHWTRQVKEVVSNQSTSELSESSGPLDEIEFWKSRCDDLSGLSEQLNQPELKQ
ncbi:Dynein heavy chain 2, axonemal, partial [Cladochytrium tenue]